MINIQSIKNKFLFQLICFLLLLLTLSVILVFSADAFMRAAYADHIYSFDNFAKLADRIVRIYGSMDFDCILVLGAGLKDDGTPSPMLFDRIAVADYLYKSNVCDKIIMSGDHTGNYNEVAAMKQQAMDNGVEGKNIFLDHQGYSTYESIWRAKEVFGAKRILIVSQEYHLYRALYIADQLGIDAIGVSADLREYSGSVRYEAREVLARFKDLYLAGSRTPPGTEAIPVSLDSNGNLT